MRDLNWIAVLVPMFMILTFIVDAQQYYCGTLPEKSRWLEEYQLNPELFRSGGDTILIVPISLHIVLSDDGGNHPHYPNLFDAICQLNEDFEETGIQFYIKGDLNYIQSSIWTSHGTVLEGADMMFTHNIDSTINCYIVVDPAGNCGYNLPYAGIALAHNCIGEGQHTWSHEIGHNLSLPHPFLGWEGDIYNYNDTTPLTVTYDYTYFKDTLILDTLIIDTALVEYVARINCIEAADGFCDTPADYLSYRWPCNVDNESNALQKDRDEVDFRSDGSLFMSYSFSNCQNRFSTDQMNAMRANLMDEKPELLVDPNPPQTISTIPEKIYPLEGEMVQYDDVELKWNSVESATGYLVQIARISEQNIWETAYTTDTFYHSNNMLQPFDYFWQIKAVNGSSACAPFSEMTLIDPADITAVNEIENWGQITLYPSIARSGGTLRLHFSDDSNVRQLDYSIVDNSSNTIQEGSLNNYSILELKEMIPGLYFIHFEYNGQQEVKKIIISD